MTKSIRPCILALTAIAMSTTAMAQPQVFCIVDRLGATAAAQRVEWARRCALLTNTGGPSSWFPSTKALDLTFDPAKEYREIDPDHAYSGSDNDYDVNYTYGWSLHGSSFQFSVSQETSGPTAGFWKWSLPIQRSLPLYPTFGTTPDLGNSVQLFPHPTLDDCNLYQSDPTTGARSPWTGNFYVIAYCKL